MSKIKAIKDGWSHPHSKIVKITSGTPGYKGTFVHNDIIFKFSVREQKANADYRLRGHIKILDPFIGLPIKDGEIALRVKENNPRKLKEAVAKKAADLYTRFDKEINKLLRNHSVSLAMYPLQLYRSFGSKYLQHRGSKPKYKEILSRQLESVCEKFGHTPISQITPTMCRKVYQDFGKVGRERILLAYKFFDFCRDWKAYSGENPLERIIQEEFPRKKRGDPEHLQQEAGEENVFSQKEKARSLQLIKEGLSDGRNMSILLIADGGLSAEQVSKLKWRDISFDPDDFNLVVLKLYNADNAGYTHCYDRPVFPHAGHLLHQKYEQLVEKFGVEAVQNIPVVSHAKDSKKSLSASAITAHCRKHLRDVFNGSKNPMQPECAGIQFLQNDYRNRISHICGMAVNPSAVRYMRGMSLTNDVTADSYRSFSGEDGLQYLYQYLCREQDFAHLFQEKNRDPDTPLYTIEETDDGPILRIFCKPGKITAVTKKSKIAKGTTEEIRISKKSGIELESAGFKRPRKSSKEV